MIVLMQWCVCVCVGMRGGEGVLILTTHHHSLARAKCVRLKSVCVAYERRCRTTLQSQTLHGDVGHGRGQRRDVVARLPVPLEGEARALHEEEAKDEGQG